VSAVIDSKTETNLITDIDSGKREGKEVEPAETEFQTAHVQKAEIDGGVTDIENK
jgi:hypothetical protein